MSQQQLTRDLRCRSTSSVRGGSFRSLKGHKLFRQDAVSNCSTPESTPRLLSPADAYHRPPSFAFDARNRSIGQYFSGQNSLEESRCPRAVPLLTRALSHQLPSGTTSFHHIPGNHLRQQQQQQQQKLCSNNTLNSANYTRESSSSAATSSVDSVARLSLPPSGLMEKRVSFRKSRSGLSSLAKQSEDQSSEKTSSEPDGDLECFDPFPRQKSRGMANDRLDHLRPPRLDQASSPDPPSYEQSPSYPLLTVNQSPTAAPSSMFGSLSSPRQMGFFPRSPSNFKSDCFFVFPPVIPEEQSDKFEVSVQSSTAASSATASLAPAVDVVASTSASVYKNVPFVDRQLEIPSSSSSSSSSSSHPTFSTLSTSSTSQVTSYNRLQSVASTASTSNPAVASDQKPPSASASSKSLFMPATSLTTSTTCTSGRDGSGLGKVEDSHLSRVIRSRKFLSSGHSKVVYDSDDSGNKTSCDTE